MIIYIHGFSSSGFGAKAVGLRKYCQSNDITFMELMENNGAF